MQQKFSEKAVKYMQRAYLLAIVITLASFVVSITGCNLSALPQGEYLKWVETPANGLHQAKTFGAIDFGVQYKPLDYLYAQENEGKELNETDRNQKQNQHKGMEFYTIRIAKANKSGDVLLEKISGDGEYYQRTDYYSFGFQQDIYRVQGNDTLPCSVFTYVPNYGVAPYIEFAIGFDLLPSAASAKDDVSIHVNDNVFNNGTIKFLFKQTDLQRIPKLLIQ